MYMTLSIKLVPVASPGEIEGAMDQPPPPPNQAFENRKMAT